MAPDNLTRLEALFKALGDRTRLRILALLAAGEVCVCNIHESLALPQPTVSRHLAYLRRSGLVDTRRDGVWMHYRLAPPAAKLAGAIVDAALHAVGHVPSVSSDRKKLAKVAGLDVKAAPCCEPGCCR
ncbi:MAG: metalloregulator ArsR/SmtB family transcription factor [Acidobacteriota bacterium]|nr:metalloregulator ArsR/SmtB family transcription factor [Acidobacteriota bacterium]